MTSLAYIHDCHSCYDERSIDQNKKNGGWLVGWSLGWFVVGWSLVGRWLVVGWFEGWLLLGSCWLVGCC